MLSAIILLSILSTYMSLSPKNIKELVALGLSENEAKVYVAMLSLGKTTVLAIARKSGLKRTTVYAVLDALKEYGLAGINIKGLKKKFFAEHPDQLVRLLTERKTKLEGIMPDLLSLYTLKGNTGNISYYEGLEAMKGIYDDILRKLRAGDDYMVIANEEKWFAQDPEYLMSFMQRRIVKKPNARLLYMDSPIAREHQEFAMRAGQQARFLPADTKIDVDIILTDFKLVLLELTNPPRAIVIENEVTLRAIKELFNILWKFSDRNPNTLEK